MRSHLFQTFKVLRLEVPPLSSTRVSYATQSKPFKSNVDSKKSSNSQTSQSGRQALNLGYFTGNPHYFDALLRANEYIRRFCDGNFAVQASDSASWNTRWLSEKEMEKVHNMKLEDGFHAKLLERLGILQRYVSRHDYQAAAKGLKQDDSAAEKEFNLEASNGEQEANSGGEALDDELYDLRQFLFRFYRPGAASKPAPRPKIRKVNGRVWARGSRKTARAEVWLVAGNGQIFVNGINIVDYFPRLSDRDTIVRPFTLTEKLGAYNVWATVSPIQAPNNLLKRNEDGEFIPKTEVTLKGNALLVSKSAEAAALSNAVARALAVMEPSVRPALKQAQLLKTDLRQVERKKPGQPKARKKFTWVKR